MNILGNQTETIEATNRTNPITPRDLVIPGCFNVKFMITYSMLHKSFSIRTSRKIDGV